MEQYLIDTNVVSDYFSASFPAAGMDLMDSAIDAIPNISILTQIELLCWNTDEATTESVKDFIADSVVLDISPDVITHCVALRKGKKIKTPDAIIAATALSYGYTIITANEKILPILKV
ncbi:MAG: type II toxin-antitoxin system VapC family toxin [Saprospiraceae bacterium]|nr:type II toxin-antitoxin system VapC family toxin [Saprospiraceae bacterium]MBK9377086.1 type II toxin-antitoxin system VapC family toxin [Saprospiraceae bacterium]